MSSAGGIDARDLVKSYKGPHGQPIEAVKGVSLSIGTGQSVALLGPNGAGKSTTIDMLLGLTTPDAGSIAVFDQSPADAVAAGRVGGMLQTGSLIRDVTVRELVALIAALYPHPLPVDEALRLAGLEKVADQRTTKLSGGQEQRTRFAVALVSGADLLVLDEPTVALDVEARREFWTTIRRVASEGKTVLFATHYLEEADQNADRVVLMARGQVVADGSTSEIKSRVGARTIRATLPDVETSALSDLPGVGGADRHGDTVILRCPDSDSAIRALLAEFPQIHDIEIAGAALEDAFLELTAAGEEARA